PSYNPFKGSQVFMLNFSEDLKPTSKQTKPKNEPFFEPPDEQALNKSCAGNETSSEQALVPSKNYINNTNITNEKNISNLNEQAKKIEEINNSDFKIPKTPLSFGEGPGEREKEKSSAKKEKEEKFQPTIEDVKAYFQENNFPEIEAQKFFNYFSSNGWLVGGKTEMKDWQAAARNWMLNSKKFNHYEESEDRAKHLNSSTGKDYSEP